MNIMDLSLEVVVLILSFKIQTMQLLMLLTNVGLSVFSLFAIKSIMESQALFAVN